MGITILRGPQYLCGNGQRCIPAVGRQERSRHCWYALVRCIARGQGNRAGFTQDVISTGILFMAQNTLCQLNVMAKVKCLISISCIIPQRRKWRHLRHYCNGNRCNRESGSKDHCREQRKRIQATGRLFAGTCMDHR